MSNQNYSIFFAKLDIEYLICFFLCQSLKMDIAQSQLWIKMSELFQNKDNADVTLVCEGETILAHSAILELRWDGQMLRRVRL